MLPFAVPRLFLYAQQLRQTRVKDVSSLVFRFSLTNSTVFLYFQGVPVCTRTLGHTCHRAWLEVRGQLSGVGSFSPCGSGTELLLPSMHCHTHSCLFGFCPSVCLFFKIGSCHVTQAGFYTIASCFSLWSAQLLESLCLASFTPSKNRAN